MTPCITRTLLCRRRQAAGTRQKKRVRCVREAGKKDGKRNFTKEEEEIERKYKTPCNICDRQSAKKRAPTKLAGCRNQDLRVREAGRDPHLSPPPPAAPPFPLYFDKGKNSKC